jgi:hypothetical protein
LLFVLFFLKIGPVGAELFHADRWRGGRADGRTDMTKLIVAIRNFANALKKQKMAEVAGGI